MYIGFVPIDINKIEMNLKKSRHNIYPKYFNKTCHQLTTNGCYL